MTQKYDASSSVVRRLPRYYRLLGELERNGQVRTSSRELGRRLGMTASQIRQDLCCFGCFGQQGSGYSVAELRENLQKIIANKQTLFQRAFRTDSTEIEITEEKINFSCKAVPYKIATGRWEKLQFHSYHPWSVATSLSDGGG